MSDHEQRLAKLQKQFHGLRIMGGEGVIVHGSPSRGYAVEIRGRAADSGTGGGVGPTPTGACCIGTDCSILTDADCATMGGTYQGDGAVCDPNPCLTGGACCFDDFCDIETETACVDDSGGIFKGIGTTCEDENICPVGPCCFAIGDSFACDVRANETNCTNDGGVFLGVLGVPCDPNPCLCPAQPLVYSVFDVQLRIYGNVDFRYCDVDCMTGVDDPQTVDFTINLIDNGDGSAELFTTRGDNFTCGGSNDTGAQAFLLCCQKDCGICAHSEIWEMEIFINMFFCNDGGTNCGSDPDVGTLSQIEAGMWDPDCEFNATHVPIQLNVYPFPNGTYTGTTSFTEQGTHFGVCDTRPVLGGGLGILGDLSIDWQVTIVP